MLSRLAIPRRLRSDLCCRRPKTKARALVLEAGIPVPSMMEFILAKAAANAKAIASMTSGKTAPAAAPRLRPLPRKRKKRRRMKETPQQDLVLYSVNLV